jgi:hypothetical protein
MLLFSFSIPFERFKQKSNRVGGAGGKEGKNTRISTGAWGTSSNLERQEKCKIVKKKCH